VRPSSHRALAARELRLQEYPLWEDWRRQAHALKAQVVDRLEAYLDGLKTAVAAWGGVVLEASDAAQARRLILGIAKRHGAARVVKSKSMTTEEIGLNPALAAAGLTVRETDLGEFIVQLAGHPPAHLTAPALHLDRRQIAAIFDRQLAPTTSQDPVDLTRQASEFLKPIYWQADLGITGVNFATPDGRLICLENECNLRLSATLPQVHVALMGLEKLIPRLADLPVFLRLLPASATGQRLTSLMHMLRGLKNHPQGRQAFYLIILDNGRRRLAARPELRQALYCLRCGACLNICPVFQTGAAHVYGRVYPGAIGILLAPYLAPVGDIASLCTQCGACQDFCPAAIPLPDLIRQVRRNSPGYKNLRLVSSAAGLCLRRPRLYRGLAAWGRRLAPFIPAAASAEAAGFSLAPESFHEWQQRRQTGQAASLETAAVTTVADSHVPSPLTLTLSPRRGERGQEDGNSDNHVGQTDDHPNMDCPSPPPGPLEPEALLARRLAEAGGSLTRLSGAEALARHLAGQDSPVWLADHAWLEPVARKLTEMGCPHQVAREVWGPEAGAAVMAALAAAPETGSVLVAASDGPSAWLGFRAHKLIVLVPPDRADLSLSQILALLENQAPGMYSLLTGPSRTADIEKTLVLGAQGPAALEVILYRPD
jgi:L-lactate dehydrogenase complex protein LldF